MSARGARADDAGEPPVAALWGLLSRIEEPWHNADNEVRRVQAGGSLHGRGEAVLVGEILACETVGTKGHGRSVPLVRFMACDFGLIGVATRLSGRLAKLGQLMDGAEHDVPARLSHDASLSNESALLRPSGATRLAQFDEWVARRARYISLEKLAQFSDDPRAPPRRVPAA